MKSLESLTKEVINKHIEEAFEEAVKEFSESANEKFKKICLTKFVQISADVFKNLKIQTGDREVVYKLIIEDRS